MRPEVRGWSNERKSQLVQEFIIQLYQEKQSNQKCFLTINRTAIVFGLEFVASNSAKSRIDQQPRIHSASPILLLPESHVN